MHCNREGGWCVLVEDLDYACLVPIGIHIAKDAVILMLVVLVLISLGIYCKQCISKTLTTRRWETSPAYRGNAWFQVRKNLSGTKQWPLLVEFYQVFHYLSLLQPQGDSRLHKYLNSSIILMNVLNHYISVRAAICFSVAQRHSSFQKQKKRTDTQLLISRLEDIKFWPSVRLSFPNCLYCIDLSGVHSSAI